MIGFAVLVGVVDVLTLSLVMQHGVSRLFIAVRRVLDQRVLCVLETLCLAAACLADSLPRGIRALPGAAAYVRRFGFREAHLLLIILVLSAIRRSWAHGS